LPRLPSRLRLYIFGVAIAAIGVFALCRRAWTIQAPSWEQLLLSLGFAVIIAFAYRNPLRVARQLNVQVETAALFAALLIFKPPLASLIAMVGVVVPLVVARRIWLEILFNTSQTGLYVAVAGAVYHLITASSPLPGSVNIVVAVVMAAVSSYLGNTLLVATAVGLQLDMHPIGVWLANWRYDISEHAALYLLGMLTALVVHHYSWALLLTVLPLGIVYISLQRSVHLRLQTKEALEALADVVDMRDPYTFAHSKRVAEYAYELAKAMKLPPQEVELIASAARVHDLGKVGITEAVLNKPGRLDEQQWEQMRQHSHKGAQIVGRFPYYTDGRELILHHHERMDGRGYPDGVGGEQLSIGARIIAVADALDAMTTDRPYRKTLPLDVVLGEFKKGSGSQWDARVVEQLLSMLSGGHVSEDTPQPFVELATHLTENGRSRGA
jgi:HD-GYP domain-containing protein (c-di-GMP phosphodiesterase class II)